MTVIGFRGRSTADTASPAPDGRDRYIDSLRALALVRVVTYHLFGWAWLPLLFPSMPVMFALAGGLVAASLSRMDHWTMLRKRLRRLLPPLWALGAVLVPAMLAVGWSYDAVTYTGSPLTWSSLATWVVPVYTPGGSAWGAPFVSPLWYLSAYLWFLVLSPGLLWLWRRWPRRTLAAPLLVVLLFTLGVAVPNGSRTDSMTLILATYGACWLLGFAHQDGSLRRLPVRTVVPLAVSLIAAGAVYVHTFPDAELGANIDAVPFANALYGLGYTLLLLRFYPSFDGLRRHKVLDRLVAAINGRAMTIYLWHNLAIGGAIAIERGWLGGRWYPYDHDGWGRLVQYAVAWVLIGVVVLLAGWVEDVAAKRPPRLLPWSGPTRRHAQVRRRWSPLDPAPHGRTRRRVRPAAHDAAEAAVQAAAPAPASAPSPVPAAPAHLVIDLRDGRPPSLHRDAVQERS